MAISVVTDPVAYPVVVVLCLVLDGGKRFLGFVPLVLLFF